MPLNDGSVAKSTENVSIRDLLEARKHGHTIAKGFYGADRTPDWNSDAESVSSMPVTQNGVDASTKELADQYKDKAIQPGEPAEGLNAVLDSIDYSDPENNHRLNGLDESIRNSFLDNLKKVTGTDYDLELDDTGSYYKLVPRK